MGVHAPPRGHPRARDRAARLQFERDHRGRGLGGHGLAWLPTDVVQDHVAAGRLVPVLDDWAATFDGYPACFATRRASPAVMRVLEALKQTPKAA